LTTLVDGNTSAGKAHLTCTDSMTVASDLWPRIFCQQFSFT